MKRAIIFFSLVILGFFISGFSNSKKPLNEKLIISKEISTVPTEEESILVQYRIPFVGKGFTGFKEAIAFKESQGNYGAVNELGYLGKYQFGKSTLHRFKIYDLEGFLLNPELQEDTFIALCSLNKWILRKDIRKSIGKKMNGIEITESGILAAAHLAGAGNVKKYLRSNGEASFKDAFGSSVQYYLEHFSGYNTSFILARREPAL